MDNASLAHYGGDFSWFQLVFILKWTLFCYLVVILKLSSSEASADSGINYMPVVTFIERLDVKQNASFQNRNQLESGAMAKPIVKIAGGDQNNRCFWSSPGLFPHAEAASGNLVNRRPADKLSSGYDRVNRQKLYAAKAGTWSQSPEDTPPIAHQSDRRP